MVNLGAFFAGINAGGILILIVRASSREDGETQ
jgi:hypothetical protein